MDYKKASVTPVPVLPGWMMERTYEPMQESYVVRFRYALAYDGVKIVNEEVTMTLLALTQDSGHIMDAVDESMMRRLLAMLGPAVVRLKSATLP